MRFSALHHYGRLEELPTKSEQSKIDTGIVDHTDDARTPLGAHAE